jgi:hypothetical protein
MNSSEVAKSSEKVAKFVTGSSSENPYSYRVSQLRYFFLYSGGVLITPRRRGAKVILLSVIKTIDRWTYGK